MAFFTSGIFWFLEGIVVCVSLMGLRVWAEDRGIPMPFWKWPVVCAWMLFAGFCIAFVGTCIGEGELTAAIKGGIVGGVICIVTGVGLWRLLFRRRASNGD